VITHKEFLYTNNKYGNKLYATSKCKNIYEIYLGNVVILCTQHFRIHVTQSLLFKRRSYSNLNACNKKLHSIYEYIKHELGMWKQCYYTDDDER
jgi:hypothetical protein